ncbi:MAG TPA: glycosyltransferase [Gemmatimonadales bacterium]|nr:glycosyltransferase [Gemmatimonadales bacterium]
MTRRVLMACANYWSSPFQVGSHHLARGFAALGWEVAFVSDPISPLHWLGPRSPELRERLDIYRSGGRRVLDGRVWTYVPGALATPHNKPGLRGDRLQRSWWRLSVPDARRVVRAHGFGEPDLIYLDSVAQRFWLDALPHRRSVFRLADNNTGFGKSTPAMQRLEREVAQRVDAVAYTAESLRPHVEALGARRAFHLPNGVNFAHFATPRPEPPAEYASLPGPIAIYVGALDVWFDYDLLAHAAERLPEISFVVIGPDALARTRLAPRPNLHLLGRRPYEQLPAYLQHADVGLIPFDVAGHPSLVHSINPLKLYEYLASGIPTVSVAWRELHALASPATLTETPDEFVAAIRAAVAAPPPREGLVAYAERADWTSRVQQLQRELEL